MDKIDETKDMRGKTEERLVRKKGWNEVFGHVRLMVAYD